MKRTLLYIVFALVCGSAHAAAPIPIVVQWMQEVVSLGGDPVVEEETDCYCRIRMADSCYLEVQDLRDSLLVARTVCAPVCSSVAAVYSLDGRLLHTVQPSVECIFPLAHIENGTLVWQDNTAEIWDEEERKLFNATK